MLTELKPYISDTQLNEICVKIREQFQRFCHIEKNKEYQELFLEEYSAHKRAGNVKWAIESGFPSGKMIAGLSVERKCYAGGYVRPELHNRDIIIHILSDTADTKSKTLLENYYIMNATGFDTAPVYCYLRFSVLQKDRLSLTLCLPDKDGNVVASEKLYETPKIEAVVA